MTVRLLTFMIIEIVIARNVNVINVEAKNHKNRSNIIVEVKCYDKCVRE